MSFEASADSGRSDIALYTGNDDNIINDLLTPFEFAGRRLRIVGGLLCALGGVDEEGGGTARRDSPCRADCRRRPHLTLI